MKYLSLLVTFNKNITFAFIFNERLPTVWYSKDSALLLFSREWLADTSRFIVFALPGTHNQPRHIKNRIRRKKYGLAGIQTMCSFLVLVHPSKIRSWHSQKVASNTPISHHKSDDNSDCLLVVAMGTRHSTGHFNAFLLFYFYFLAFCIPKPTIQWFLVGWPFMLLCTLKMFT